MNSKKAENYIDFYLRHTWHKVSRMYNQQAKVHGLTMSIGFILLIIEKKGSPSTQLGPRMGMEPTSLSRTLKSMEKKGYIYREIDKDDKRRVLIYLTEEGLALRRQVREVVKEFNEKLLNTISPKKLEAFYDVMKVVDSYVDSELENINKNKLNHVLNGKKN